jgi:hypothetical protein
MHSLNDTALESLVRFVAEQCGLPEELGTKGKSGILKNQESRAKFLHREDPQDTLCVHAKTLLMDEPD